MSGARDIIFSGLKSLEYRGYDSAGIALMEFSAAGDAKTAFVKMPGKLDNLKAELPKLSLSSSQGIGHTRWATHGEANQINSHPHRMGPITIVHNGIIENHNELRGSLQKSDFLSQTDSEVFAHLVAEARARGLSLLEAVRTSFQRLDGNSAFVIMDDTSPGTLIAIRKGASPLVIGRATGLGLVASDVPALLKHTRDVYYLRENEIAVLTKESIQILDLQGNARTADFQRIDWDAEAIDKMGYPHFMLKEIHEQPRAMDDTLRPWIDSRAKKIRLKVDGISADLVDKLIREASGMQIVACGTAFNACLFGQILLEKMARIPVRAELAHEYRYRSPVIVPSDLGIVVSQSGETADSLAAARLMRENGMKVFCITNVPSSSLARECDGAFFMNAGIEVGVASTKAYLTMLAVFAALTGFAASARGHISAEAEALWVRDLESLPLHLTALLKNTDRYSLLAQKFLTQRGYLYIGRGAYFGSALEGALKLKELAYVHAEGFAGGELKHGPIALVEPEMLIVAIAPDGQGELHAKTLSNIEEVRARRGTILGIGREDDREFAKMSNEFIALPKLASTELYPILAAIPLQLLAYTISVAKGCEVDQPRNLAKSVTVE